MFAPWERRGRKLIAPLTQLAALVLIGLVFHLGVSSERTGFVREVLDPGFRKLSAPVLNAFRKKPPPVPLFALTLDVKDADSLKVLEQQAFTTRRVLVEDLSAFNGMLRIGEREIPVAVNLRAGAIPPGPIGHWPIQLRALPSDTILGMQTFDLMPVVDGTALWSMLLHDMLKNLGGPSLPSGLAELELNGKNRGLYMAMGRPDTRTIAGWSRGSGPTMRYDESLRLNTRSAMAQREFPSTQPPQGEWLSAPLLMQNVEGRAATERAQRAIRQMEGFRAGDRKASQVFDVPSVARLLALCDLLGTRSATAWWNLQFVLDSVSSKLVPVPMHILQHGPIDAISGTRLFTDNGNMDAGQELERRWLMDTVIFHAYIAYLDTFSTPGWWEQELERTRLTWGAARNVIHSADRSRDLDLQIVEHDRTVIRQTLYPRDLALAYMRNANDPADGLAIANVHELPIELTGLIFGEQDTVWLLKRMHLLPRDRDKPLHYVVLPFTSLEGYGIPREIVIQVTDAIPARTTHIRSWSTFGAN